MSDPQITEEPGLTHESWRPKFYGLIKEGRKIRVSNFALRMGLLAIGLLVVAVQFLSSFNIRGEKVPSASFTIPFVHGESESVYVPPVMNSAKDYELEQDRARGLTAMRTSQKVVEKIMPIKLSQVKGIPSGAEVMGTLASGGSNGFVKVILSENLKFDGDIILTKGTTLLGQGSSNDERLYIAFTKAVMPDKTELKIKAFAFDKEDRIIGLKGKKISDYAFKLAASAGMIFLGGMADGMRDDNSTNPFVQKRPTTRDAALNGVSTATLETGKDMMDSMKNQQSRVEVASATSVLIIFGDVDER